MRSEGDGVSALEGPRSGQISALLKELVQPPEADPRSAWAAALQPGAVVAERFELVREVGRGSFGIVYEARDRALGRTVAFKAVSGARRPALSEDLLLREAEAAAQCSHPNIVALYDLGHCEHGPFLVLEFLRGETLAARLERGPLAPAASLRVAVEVARGLAHAHAHGVIHRDLTPTNVFLCDDGQVKILDLGMAHAFGLRRVDGGTPEYMAPEQRRGAPEDERTDVFAAGVLLYRMLSGRLPFPRGKAPARAPAALRVPAAPGLGALVARALQLDPVRRQRDAGVLLAELHDVERELDRALALSARVVATPRRGVPVRATTAVLVGLIASVVAAAATLAVLRLHSTRRAAPVLAVMRFANLSGDPGQDYLGDGIAQEIAGKLSSVVPVVDRTSVEPYERAHQGAARIGRELRVAYVVQGTVRRQAGRLRVNAAVVRTSDSRQMWTDELDVPFDQVLLAPERVAFRVLQAIGITLGPEDRRSLGRWATRSAQAYDEYLQGEFAFSTDFDAAKFREAALHYERALALDPDYAPALAELASVEVGTFRSFDPAPERLARADLLARRALAIDAKLDTARLVSGQVRASLFDYAGAADIFQRLVGDDPRNFWAWDNLCWVLGYVWPRRLAEAERACRRALEINPSYGDTYYHLLRAVAAQKRPGEAAEVLAQLEKRLAGSALVCAGRYTAAIEDGRPREALSELTACRDFSSTSLGLAWQATALARMGSLDDALARLDDALAKGYRDLADLRLSPSNQPLRDDPRFEPLLARYGRSR